MHIIDEIPLSFSVAASSALRIGLASPASSALPIGTRAYRTGSRSSPYTHYSVWTCRKGVPRTLLADAHRLSVLPYRCQGNSRFGNSQPICLRLCEIGNGVQDDIILRGQSGALRIVPHTDGKEREVIHKALEEVARISLLALLSDMGNIFWSKTTFEVAVAEFIATGDIRKTDNEVGFSFILVSQLLTFSFGEFDVYSSSSQIVDKAGEDNSPTCTP